MFSQIRFDTLPRLTATNRRKPETAKQSLFLLYDGSLVASLECNLIRDWRGAHRGTLWESVGSPFRKKRSLGSATHCLKILHLNSEFRAENCFNILDSSEVLHFICGADQMLGLEQPRKGRGAAASLAQVNY